MTYTPLFGLVASLSLVACIGNTGGGTPCPQSVQTQGGDGSHQGTATLAVGTAPPAIESTYLTGSFDAGVGKAGSFSLSGQTSGGHTLTLSGNVSEVGTAPVGKWPSEESVNVSLDDCAGTVTAAVMVEITDHAGALVGDASAHQEVTSDFHVKGVLHIDVTQSQTFGGVDHCTLAAEHDAIPFELVQQDACMEM